MSASFFVSSKKSLSLLFLLSLGICLVSLGCTGARSAGGDDDDSGEDGDGDGDGDDDDASGDDDDASGSGDDDDASGDDDDASGSGDDDDTSGGADLGIEGITFSVEIEASETGVGTGIAATFIFSYWETYNQTTQTLDCNQRVEIEGTAAFGTGLMADCANCTGRITFDESTAQDISNPTTTPDDCDVAQLQTAGADFGSYMLTPTGDTGYGDFLDLPLVDADTYETLGLTASQDGANPYDAAAVTTYLTNFQAEFSHMGYVAAGEGTLSQSSNLAAVAEDAGAGGSDYFSYFMIGKATGNTYAGTGMDGAYVGVPIWMVNFESQ